VRMLVVMFSSVYLWVKGSPSRIGNPAVPAPLTLQ
jgi:hypothetical protein